MQSPHNHAGILGLFSLVFFGMAFVHSGPVTERVATYAAAAYASVSTFGQPSITVAELNSTHQKATRTDNTKIKILIVPGHEPQAGGTVFADVAEKDIVAALGQELAHFFAADSRYEVTVSRTSTAWNPLFEGYFKRELEDIPEWINTYREKMEDHVADGDVAIVNGVFHNETPKDVALRLYALNKWANENGYDLVLHLHINDHPRKNTRVAGKYSGFSIYVPERQYSNAGASHAVAQTVFQRIATTLAISNLPKENVGIVEDQELIAIGSKNTLNAVSLLIEYGYIYEPYYEYSIIRNRVVKELAYQTFRGVQDFFDHRTMITMPVETDILPYIWEHDLQRSDTPSVDVLALQTALGVNGFYPPVPSDRHECPLTGIIGPCTLRALAQFQLAHEISGEADVVGPKSRALLEQLVKVN